MTRHFYKHRVTGLVAPLDDTFAEVFGDRFERVGNPSEGDTVVGTTAVPTDTTEADANAPVDADANPANTGVNP